MHFFINIDTILKNDSLKACKLKLQNMAATPKALLYLPILMNFGLSNSPSVSNQLGDTKAINTNKKATAVQPVAIFPVFDFPIFIFMFSLNKCYFQVV